MNKIINIKKTPILYKNTKWFVTNNNETKMFYILFYDLARCIIFIV